MRFLLWRLSSLLGGVAMLIVGVGLLFSVLGLRAGEADFSGVALGLITSAYFVGFVAGTYLCPKIIRKVGHIRAFAAMASLASTMPILHALWMDPWFWGALRFITGTCLVGLYIVVESWLNTLAPNEHRGRLFSVYMAVNFVALALGQWLILVDSSGGFVPFALVSVMFSFALLPITMTPVDQPQPVDAPRLSMRTLYKASPVGVAAAMASGLISGAFYGMGALFAQGVGLQDQSVAAFLAAAILGGALFQWPVGHYSDRHDRRWVLFFVCAMGVVVCLAVQALARVSVASLFPLAVVFGGMIFAVYGLGVAHTNDVVDSTRLVEFTGGLLLVHGTGAALGPTVAGVVMDYFGPSTLMFYFAVVLAGMAAYALKRITTVAPVPEEAKGDFVVMGAGSQAVLHMDPRSLAEELPSEGPEPELAAMGGEEAERPAPQHE
ncbi:MFS transporter [Hydrogenophaga sp. 5NK40-0174]|uniref:MFS transporter n=1 Tax=Hydrogenophaga sp. 5NK40-0174 TaxID=3127649 RepID=UPI0033402E24